MASGYYAGAGLAQVILNAKTGWIPACVGMTRFTK